MNYWSIFLTGLFAGGLSCLAVQGGLLAASLAQRKEYPDDQTSNTAPIIAFLVMRLLAYTTLGFLFGVVGSAAQLSLSARLLMQTIAAIFMIGTALNMLNVHPIFRYFVIQPPRFLTRIVRNQSKSKALFGPGLLGAATIFIPCGTTQAMMAYAITTGSPLWSAGVMAAFILGTSPLFFALGMSTKLITGAVQTTLSKVVAVIIIGIAVFNLNAAVALSGSTVTLETIGRDIFCTFSFCKNTQGVAVNTDSVSIIFTPRGYMTEPSLATIKAGSTINITLVNKNAGGCIQDFTIPTLGIQEIIGIGQTKTIQITAPQTPGPLPFMCSMGMFRGSLMVI